MISKDGPYQAGALIRTLTLPRWRERSNFQTRFLLIYVFNGANKLIMVVLRLLKFSQKKFSYPLIGVLTENV